MQKSMSRFRFPLNGVLHRTRSYGMAIATQSQLWRHQSTSFNSQSDVEIFVRQYTESGEKKWEPKKCWDTTPRFWRGKRAMSLEEAAADLSGAFIGWKSIGFDIEEFTSTMVMFRQHGVMKTFENGELPLVTKCVVHVDEDGNVAREGFTMDRKYVNAINQVAETWRQKNGIKAM